MCKHVAAVLYGIGSRLDHQPESLFTLRNVDKEDLVANAGTGLSRTRKRPADARVLAADDLAEMFGIDMAPSAAPTQPPARVVATSHSTAFTTAGATAVVHEERTRPPKSKKPARKGERQRLTAKKRQQIAERMRTYWADRRAQMEKRKAAKRQP
jgi:uncharacterized Zn finger protein